MWVYMLMMPVWRASLSDGSSSIPALEDGRWGWGGSRSRPLASLPLSLSLRNPFFFPVKAEFYYGEGCVFRIHTPGFCLGKVTKQGNNATSARLINIHKQNIRHWVDFTISWDDVLNIHEADVRHWTITTQRQHVLINIYELGLRHRRDHSEWPHNMTTQRSEISHVSNINDMRLLIKQMIKNVLEKKIQT